MKTFYILPFILVFTSVLLASNFNDVDANLTETTRVNSLTAKRKLSWAEEKARLEALEESYRAILKAKVDSLKNLESEISKLANTALPISKKIKKDEVSLKEISSHLNDGLRALKNFSSNFLKEESPLLDDSYITKDELEKLSLFCRICDKIRLASERVVIKGDDVSTGIAPVVRGKLKGDIAILKVEEGAKK